MVVTSWKSNEQIPQNPSISDSSSDSNSGNSTKQKNISSSALNVLNALKKRHASLSNPVKSLELLRMSIQSYFDREVDQVVRKFVAQFFSPAIKNLKDNLGDDIVSDDQVQTLCCALLENAKSQYLSNYLPSPSSSTTSRNTPEMEVSDSDSSNENAATLGIPSGTSLLQQALKRKRTESESENFSKRQFFLTTQTPLVQQYFQSAQSPISSTNALIVSTSTAPAFTTNTINPNITTAPTLLGSTISTPKITTKQVVWNIAPPSITSETLFILDSKVTQALGITDFREKLSGITPFRYVVDNEDLLWLVQQKMLNNVQRIGRIYLLILSEIEKLVDQTAEYKNSPNLKLNELVGFKVPEFLYKKIQKFSSSQFLLSVANPQSQNIIVPASNSMAQGFFTKQSTFGGQQPISFHIIQTAGNRNIGGFALQSQSSNAAQQIQKLIRTTSLSSSHATLTKLLSNQIQNAAPNSTGNTKVVVNTSINPNTSSDSSGNSNGNTSTSSHANEG